MKRLPLILLSLTTLPPLCSVSCGKEHGGTIQTL